jgi:hypothetical protein
MGQAQQLVQQIMLSELEGSNSVTERYYKNFVNENVLFLDPQNSCFGNFPMCFAKEYS